MSIPLLTAAAVFRLQTNICKRHHRITLCRNPQLLWVCRYLYPINMDSISAQGINTLICKAPFCSAIQDMAVFLFVLWTNKKNSHRSIAGTNRPSNFTYLAKRLCLLDFRQREISLWNPFSFRWDGSSQRKAIKEAVPPPCTTVHYPT